MTTINPWINFNGNAEEAFGFYRSIFGGELGGIIRMKDLASEEFRVPEADAEKLMRIVLTLGDGNELIGNDVPSFMGQVSERENRSKIAVRAVSKEEGDAIFDGLADGGEVEVPMSESAWGSRFGMLRDRYGIEWTVEHSA